MQAACGLVSGPFIALLKAMLAAQSGQAGWLNVRPPLRPATLADGVRAAGPARRAGAPMRRVTDAAAATRAPPSEAARPGL